MDTNKKAHCIHRRVYEKECTIIAILSSEELETETIEEPYICTTFVSIEEYFKSNLYCSGDRDYQKLCELLK